jgi:NACHT domain
MTPASWLIAFALSALAAAGAASAPYGLWRLDRRRSPEVSIPQARARDRDAILHRVRDKWISGVLEPSLAHAERLALDLARHPEAVAPRETLVPHPDYATLYANAGGTIPMNAPIIAGGTPVLRLFLRTGGGLLIMGAPGSGKTTLLLQLADALLQRAESDASQPVPIVASLASWGGRHQSLTTWLAGELAESYRIPRETADSWLATGDLVLLLDGLDEVTQRYRGFCAEEINAYLRRHGLARMAVCARSGVLRDLGTRLVLPEAVELLPATEAQIDAYLARLETTWTPLADVRAALAADESLRTPLMLRAAALAYRGRTGPLLPQSSAPEWPPEIAALLAETGTWITEQDQTASHAALWEAYLARMLEPQSQFDGREIASPDPELARGYLAWLAAMLRDADRPEFQLDRLAPTWTVGAAHDRQFGRLRPLVARLDRIAAAGAGLGSARAASASAHSVPSGSHASPLGSHAFPSGGRGGSHALAPGAERPAHPGAHDRIVSRLGARTLAWLGRLTRIATSPAEEYSWGPAAGGAPPRLSRPMLVLVLVTPLVTAAVSLLAGLWIVPLAALGAGLLWGVNLPPRLGLVPRPRRWRVVPDEGIRRSARYGALTAAVAAVSYGIGLCLAFRLLYHPLRGSAGTLALVAALLAGAGAGLANGGGACLRHYAVRAGLVRQGVMPWRFRSFLDAMTARGLLRRTGTGYAFIHRMLLDHLAPAGGATPAGDAAPGSWTELTLCHDTAQRADQPSPERLPDGAQQPAGRDLAGAGERDGGALPQRDRPADSPRGGDVPHAADQDQQRPLGGRGRDVHRLLVDLHRARPRG